MAYKQENLFDIFQREKQRFADEPISISYNTKSNTIQYKDEENNVMTVQMRPNEGRDYIYYREHNAPKGSGFGYEVASINIDANYYGDDIRTFPKMSDGLQRIADSWYMDRKEIGVEKTNKPHPPVKKFDKDIFTICMPEDYKKTYDFWKPHYEYEYKSKAKTMQEMLGL